MIKLWSQFEGMTMELHSGGKTKQVGFCAVQSTKDLKVLL